MTALSTAIRHGHTKMKDRLLLLVEDNPGDADYVQELLEMSSRHKYRVVHVERLDEAVTHLATHPVDVVLLDLRLPDAVGTPAVRAVRSVSIDVPLLVLTGTEDDELAQSCIDAGADDYLCKADVQPVALQRAIGYAISRKNLERQFQAAQRMEAVGTLAGGVAHDFNNLLTAIFGYADAAQHKLEDDHPAHEDLASVLTVAERAAALTRQLLAFSRQQVMDAKVLNLQDVITGMSKIIRRLLPEDVKLIVGPSAGAHHVFADPVQIEQIVVNLVINARDAMPEGGTLTIEVTDEQLDEAYLLHRPTVPPGEYVVLTVSDTGTGMDEETQDRIFEPFFTTKEVGKGTGLGLATVYGIVKQSQGYVWVYSEPGAGTVFRIYFPRSQRASPDATAVEDVAVSVAGGTETVLFVEDDDAVRGAGTRALQRQGYRVLPASNGAHALEIVGAYDGPIHVLVTDVVMPVMGGKHLVREFRKHRPETPVLFTSGYMRHAAVQQGIVSSEIGFLNKPYTPMGLARKVRDLLDARAKRGNTGV